MFVTAPHYVRAVNTITSSSKRERRSELLARATPELVRELADQALDAPGAERDVIEGAVIGLPHLTQRARGLGQRDAVPAPQRVAGLHDDLVEALRPRRGRRQQAGHRDHGRRHPRGQHVVPHPVPEKIPPRIAPVLAPVNPRGPQRRHQAGLL
mgnify:CR=1 FL=1